MIKKYTKKPVTVETMLYDGNNIDEVIKFTNGKAYKSFSGKLYIKTLEGDLRANVGDYIIKGVQGEFYACKPNIFHETHEEAGQPLEIELGFGDICIFPFDYINRNTGCVCISKPSQKGIVGEYNRVDSDKGLKESNPIAILEFRSIKSIEVLEWALAEAKKYIEEETV